MRGEDKKEHQLTRSELIQYRNEMTKGMKGYVFRRHLNHGKMSGFFAIITGIYLISVVVSRGQWMFIPAMIFTFIVGAISISTSNAAEKVDKLSNAESDEEYEDKLATYDYLTNLGVKLILYGSIIAVVISIVTLYVIVSQTKWQ